MWVLILTGTGTTLRLLLATVLLAAAPVAAHAEVPVCPPEHPMARRMAEKMLTSEGLARERTESGVSEVSTSQIRLLTDAADGGICQRLNALLGASGTYAEWRWTAYRVGTFYFIAYLPISQDSHQPHFLPLMILDAKLNRVNIYAL
jgi:hypothetical protein